MRVFLTDLNQSSTNSVLLQKFASDYAFYALLDYVLMSTEWKLTKLGLTRDATKHWNSNLTNNY